MFGMRLDHISFAAGPDGLAATAQRLGELLGKEFDDGGIHPRFGTRNRILPLADNTYLEIVEVLDHPASDKAPFGQAVRARSALGGGWLGWVVSVDDLEPFEARLERQSVPGSRMFPDGRKLEWRQIGIRGLMADPQLPYFLEWQSDETIRPGALSSDVRLAEVEISGSSERLSEWLGHEVVDTLDGVALRLLAPNGVPGINTVTFETSSGRVTI